MNSPTGQAETHAPLRFTRRGFLRLSAGATLAVLLPGCHRAPSSSPAPAAPSDTVPTATYAKPAPWKLGRSGRGDMTAWMIMYSAHVEYGAREKLSSQFSEYVCTSANWDPNKQIEDIKHLQAQGIDLLLIDPLDSALVRDGVEQAARAGLPVILAPTSAQTQQYVSWVATGEAARGSACVEWLVGAMPRGRVVVLQSLPAAGDGAAWLSGVQNALARYPALNVTLLRCAWSSSEAKRIMSAHLCQVGGVDGLIVNNGVLGMGSVQAFLECNQPIPLIAGADDWNGWLRIAKQHAVQFLALNGGANLGLYCVELATQILSGHPVPHRIDIPYVSFDNRELDAYYRPDLSDHYWAMHDLPEAWITRMYKP